MNFRVVVAATALLLGAAPLQAAVYKCTTPSGAVEFKDKPCAPGSGGEIAIKGMEPARAAGTGGSAAPGQIPSGRWCEYAVSLDRDGDKDDSAPADWNFSDGQVEYSVKGMPTPLKARLEQNGNEFSVDHGMFGGAQRTWTVVELSRDSAIIESPIAGYYHLRRGNCS